VKLLFDQNLSHRDFHQLSFLYGPPPKAVWIQAGNTTTAEIEALLRDRVEQIRAFSEVPEEAFLVLPR